MSNIVKRVQQFISYWYLRYLMATELYMVEPWEKAVIHVLFAVLFFMFWYFNATIVLSSISRLQTTKHNLEQLL